MPAHHLTRRSHLLKAPSGHLARMCDTGGGGGPVPCTIACPAVDPDPECCWFSRMDPTPTSESITIISVAWQGCFWDTASPFYKFIVDGSGLSGTTFCLPYIPSCTFSAVFDVTGAVKLLRCYNASNLNCGGCTPSTDITVAARLTIIWNPIGTPNFTLEISSTDTNWSPPGAFNLVTMGMANPVITSTDCCHAWSAVGDGPTGGTDPVLIVTALSGAPCC